MKKLNVLVLALALICACVFSACGSQEAKKEDTKAAETAAENKEDATKEEQQEAPKEETKAEDENANASEASEELLSGRFTAVITVKDFGEITVVLDADSAPITVTNFVNLVKEGFYDGLTFHRIIAGFMMQGGDPLGNGTGGSDKAIKGEFALNGIENNLSHTRGAISMARSQMPDSARSQFFICHQDSQFLDGQYACFGYVVEGIEVVDKICETAKVVDGNGTVPAESQPVIESIVIVE